jgi:hypothetical protein
MCALTVRRWDGDLGTMVLPGVPRRLGAWNRERQQDSARKNSVKLFDGAGDGGRTRLSGPSGEAVLIQEHETASPSI